MDDIKNKFTKANHYCYAYIVGNKQKYSDDKEPVGTAGLPILNVLKKKDLNNILCVVIRYFGGIKLGSGGLARAYSKSVTNALDNIKIIDKVDTTKIKIEFCYQDIKRIEYDISEYRILEKNFNQNITYLIEIPYYDLNEVIKKLKDKCIKIEIIN